jgi:hypothetical protein
MKRGVPVILLSLTVLVLVGGWTSPSHAYWPPLQDITGPTTSVSPEAPHVLYVNFSVHNPATNNDIPTSYVYGDDAHPRGVSQLGATDGMVYFKISDPATGPVQWRIVAAVYDPIRGWRVYEFPWTSHEPNILLPGGVKDGVLVYTQAWNVESQAWSKICYVTYDPRQGQWKEVMEPDRDGPLPPGLMTGDGVVVYYAQWDEPPYPYIIMASIYDPTIWSESGHWQSGWITNLPAEPTDLEINAGTIFFTSNGAHTLGYDYTQVFPLNWTLETYTKPQAQFAAQSTLSRTVWFTDLSLGGNSWSYDLGDGATLAARSVCHKYTRGGIYNVTYTVSGPGGSHSWSKWITAGAALPQLLLLLD